MENTTCTHGKLSWKGIIAYLTINYFSFSMDYYFIESIEIILIDLDFVY